LRGPVTVPAWRLYGPGGIPGAGDPGDAARSICWDLSDHGAR